MKTQQSIEQILSDLRTDLKKGRHQYWKMIHSGAYEDAENISLANACLRAKIELLENILTD